GLILPNLEWPSRLYLLYARLWYAVADLLANKAVKDPILFLSTMMILYWFAGLLSTYQMVRRANPWLSLLALGGMIIVIEYTMEMYRYAKVTGGTYSFFFLFFCLLLMGRIYYLRSKKAWEKRGGTVEVEVGYDLGRGVAVAALALALVAWNTPRVINFFQTENPGRERVTRSWQTFRDRISKAVNSLRSSSPVIVEGYGNNMFLGTGGNQSENEVLTVRPFSGRPTTGRFYWTARTYDTYDYGQWSTTISGSQGMGPGQGSIRYPAWNMRRETSLTFISRVPLLKTVYFAAEPLNVNREAQGVVSVSEDGTMDLNAIIFEPPLRAGEEYTVRSTVVQPTILAMRESGAEYPDWVKNRYLQLPSDFSPRITELARQIGGDEQSAYDKTMAITQYLRRTITYTESVPEPPRNREPLEWFLFDLRAGFCNYYASSEVLMLRSLGVPARLSVGYAEGTWNPEIEAFSVLGKDSHAWPEVYFPQIGWVSFEPTVSQPLGTFPTGEDSAASQQNQNAPGSTVPTFDPLSMRPQDSPYPVNPADLGNLGQKILIAPWQIALFVLLLVIMIVAVLEWRRRRIQDLPLPSWIEKSLDERGFRTPEWLRLWSRRSLRTPMENLFANVAFLLTVWGQKVQPALTPAEQVAILVNVVPGIKEYAVVLLEEYQRAMYSQYPADTFRARQAVSEMRSIGFRNWLLRLVGLES
ncbi:MAG: transglutaminase domain-containing protein, partial [Anaerolineaceae bacterium]|nr:transglutaminase domain-containing protein [Anaerolineaceae bacterium]